MNKIKRRLIYIYLILTLLCSLITPFSVSAASDDKPLKYPELNASLQYYQSTFPTGLIYSSGWWGTFAYTPDNVQVILYDDTYSDEWGICVFGLPIGVNPPSKPQGGTSLQTLTLKEVDKLLKSYKLESLVKPYDKDILDIMPSEHKYIGAWAGDKLKDKFTTSDYKDTEEVTSIDPETGNEVKTTRQKQLTPKQQEYIDATKDKKVKAVDLEKFDPDRYWVMGQVFFTDGTANCSLDGRQIADSAFTVDAAGNFTINMANGTTATVSGTNIVGSPVTLSAGANTITTTDVVADGSFDITIGTAANTNSVNSWSASSGGACGASVTTSADNAYFDANSFTAVSQVVTVNANMSCLDFIWTGASNNPTLAGSSQITVFGSATFIAAMTHTHLGAIVFVGSGTHTITFGGTVSWSPNFSTTGTYTFQDALNCGGRGFGISKATGKVDTNDQSVTCGGFIISGADAKVLDLGSSVIVINGTTGLNYSGSNLTITANTSTINISGTGAFAGGTPTGSYYDINLIGSAHTVSGTWTCHALSLPPATTQTITVIAGSSFTVTTATLAGSAGHVHTFTSTNTWTITKVGSGYITSDYINIKYSTGLPTGTWYASTHSTDSGNNTNWYFINPTLATTYSDINSYGESYILNNVNINNPKISTPTILGGTLSGTFTAGGVVTLPAFTLGGNITGSSSYILSGLGNVGIGLAPTSYLTIKAGTATAGTAPLKLTAGTNLTAPEAGAIEFDGTYLYYTTSTPTRMTLATSTSTSFPKVVRVGKVAGTGIDYTSIQSAINYAVTQTPSATNPYVIYIYPGIYDEAITLSTYVYLKGIGTTGAVVIAQTDATVCTLSTGSNQMENITFRLVTPTAARTILTDGGNAPTFVISNSFFEVTTPSDKNITVMSYTGTGTYVLDSIYFGVGGTGASVGINVGAVSNVTITNSNISFTNTNAYTLQVSADASIMLMNVSCGGTGSLMNVSAGTFIWQNCRMAATATVINTGATHNVQNCYIARPIVAGNGAIVQLKNTSYPGTVRSGTGNVVDTRESPTIGIYHAVAINWDIKPGISTSNIATRVTGGSSVTDGGTGQCVLRGKLSASEYTGVENNTDATGAYDSSFTCAYTPRSVDNFVVDTWSANAKFFTGFRATLGNVIPTAAEIHAGFIWDGTNFTASSSNGAGVGQTTNLTTPSVNVQHTYEFIIYGSIKVEFYVDGLLVATHSNAAGLPSGLVDWQKLLTTDGGGADYMNVTLRTGFKQECSQ